MKKILLIGVTYCSYDSAHEFIASVNSAAEKCNDWQVDVVIADNTPQTKQSSIIKEYDYISVETCKFPDNPGYLGAALEVYNSRSKDYDMIAISNVDLCLEQGFFKVLSEIDTSDIGWIAPNIYTHADNRYENPYMKLRPTKKNFIIWNTIYSCKLMYKLYHTLHKLKNKTPQSEKEQNIYAGHGSFMLFTKAFADNNPNLHFPGYMYGEEIYLAEITRLAKLNVRYFPTLKIQNVGHINMGNTPDKVRFSWSKHSLKTIRELFF